MWGQGVVRVGTASRVCRAEGWRCLTCHRMARFVWGWGIRRETFAACSALLCPALPALHAVLRYEISHPVVNDGNMVLWRALGVSSWPTLAVVSPQGRLIGMLPGEPPL